MSVTVDDEYVVIELKSNKKDDGHWWTGLGLGDIDVDGDGHINIMAHNIDEVYGNGLCDGNYNYLYDVCYRICYVATTEEYDNTLSIRYDELCFYDTQEIYYTANLEQVSYIAIKNSEYETVYTQNVKRSEGRIYYTPVESDGTGTYSVEMGGGGEIYAFETFDVVSCETEYAVWVDKINVLPNQGVTIFYKVPQGERGEIVVKYYNKTLESMSVDGKDSVQTIVRSFENAGFYTIEIYKNLNGSLFFKEDERLFVGILNYLNRISVSKKSYTLDDTVIITGTHNLLGFNVYVLIEPTLKTFDVSNLCEFEIQYNPDSYGDYIVNLVYGDIILDSDYFTVREKEVDINIFVENMNYFVAIAIILFFTIFAFMLSSKMRLSNEQKMLFTCVFIAIALFVCVIFSLVPLWLPFLISVLVIAFIIREVL